MTSTSIITSSSTTSVSSSTSSESIASSSKQQSSTIKFKNISKFIELTQDEINCFGVVNDGEKGYKVKNAPSTIALINSLDKISSKFTENPTKADPKFLDINYQEQTQNRIMPDSKYQNIGYSYFGCSNYASSISKFIPVRIPNSDKSISYLSFGSQGGLPIPTIEIYALKNKELMRISYMPLADDGKNLGKSCGVEFGMVVESEGAKCYQKAINETLTEEILQTKVAELSNLFALE